VPQSLKGAWRELYVRALDIGTFQLYCIGWDWKSSRYVLTAVKKEKILMV
jgi:hypothetical protein